MPSRDLAAIRAMTVKLLAPLRGVPLIGFVNAGRIDSLSQADLQTILKIWLDHGATLGNHTWSHPDLNTVPLAEYEADLLRGEPPIAQALGHRPVYFRHPFLHAGKDAATRRGLGEFLAAHDYRIAPVTLDNSDWMFAAVYASALGADPPLAARVKQAYLAYMESIFVFFEARSKEVVGREFPQTLLIHASQLNADTMPALLAMMRSRGYQFVSLETALRDEAYRLPDEYYGTGGFSWIHRWSKTKDMAPKGEPDEPAWIAEAYKNR
jgi:peptidoglycan/xylan/chitin deacetylase (PgdA/CDA1 family)